MADTVNIDGWTAPGFEAVRDVFTANLTQGLDVGAGFAAYHRGVKVVDLWGGIADVDTGRPWEEDSVILVFSTTKGATALCANILAERGELDPEAPVATYWPEFAQAGKADITVAQLLCHQAGLAWMDTPLTLAETLAWDPVVTALAAEAPHWEPGTKHGYHATTFGWLVGEVVRRVSGRSVGRFFADEVAGPLGLDFWIGLPEAEEPRVVPLIPFEIPAELTGGIDVDFRTKGFEALGALLGNDFPAIKALNTPRGAFADLYAWNSREVRAAEIPAANGVTDARSLARMYAGAIGEVGGTRVLGPAQLDRAITRRTSGPNFVLMDMDIQFGLGFMVMSSLMTLGATHGATRGFGHFGAGGSAGWADPDAGLAFGYVMNRMDMGLAGDVRSATLIEATYAAAAGQP
jgi:CubicO group peptidase (beta-lactamase class C family)